MSLSSAVTSAGDIAIFVSCRSGIGAVKKIVVRYERRAEAKINFAKNECLRLGGCRGMKPYAGMTDPSVF